MALFLARLLILLLLAIPSPAWATWLVAESPHFRVHASTPQRALEAFVRQMEEYRGVLEDFTTGGVPEAQTRLDIYLVRGASDTRIVWPAGKNIAGFYSATAESRFLITRRGRIRRVSREQQAGDDNAFHEYVHHFMLQNFPAAYPGWVIEGYAQYFQTIEFEDDRIILGKRSPTLTARAAEQWLPWSTVLSSHSSKVPRDRWSAFYGQSWLLMHYMLSDPARRARFNRYLNAVSEGAKSKDALLGALGMSEAALSSALASYARAPLTLTVMKRKPAPAALVRVQALPPAADRLLLYDLRARYWVSKADRTGFVETVRALASRYRGDAFTERALARAEALYGDTGAAEALLQRALAQKPADAEALYLLGRAQLRRAEAADTSEARAEIVAAACANFARAIKADPLRYEMLLAYARALGDAKDRGTAQRASLLIRAHNLAPQVGELRLELASALMAAGRSADAIMVLLPLANRPHGGAEAEKAAALIAAARRNAASE